MQHRNSATRGTLHLWFSTVSPATLAAETAAIQMLSASELGRLNSIGSKTRRREYLVSRALMRHALSQRFQQQDPWWRVEDSPESAPVVSNLPDHMHISLSHSNGCICFAIADCPLGVDIEAADTNRDFSALAEAFMNDAELTCLAANKLGQANYFYRVWSAKEACFKMLSPARQSVTSLNQLCYSQLSGEDTADYLYEGTMGRFIVAATLAAKPEVVCHNYFLTDKETLGHLNIYELDQC